MIDLPNPCLIGVIHLPALPGSATHLLPMDGIIDRVLADATSLEQAGFDAAIIENFGDAPFAAEHVGPATVAAMAVAVEQVRQHSKLRIGVNVLRNDAAAALGIAAAAGGTFVRINVHTGVMATDQGMITGRAEETLRYRKLLGKRIAILADVHVKHATPVSQPDLAAAARETAYRGHADALIVTGPATGTPPATEDLDTVRAAVPDRRVLVGSGATAATAAALLAACSGIIVGTGLKPGQDAAAPIDPQLAMTFAQAAGRG